MLMTNTKQTEVEVLGVERRRRWTPSEKLAMVRESFEPGMIIIMVSVTAMTHGSAVRRRIEHRRRNGGGVLADRAFR
jgi:transposase-like protein